MSCEVDGVGVRAGRADCPGAVGGVTHETVEDGPGRTEDPRWGTSGAVRTFKLGARLANLWIRGIVYYGNVSLCAYLAVRPYLDLPVASRQHIASESL